MLVGPTSGKRSVFSRCEKAIALYCRASARFFACRNLKGFGWRAKAGSSSVFASQ